MSQSQPRLKTSAMIASIADEGQATVPAPFGVALSKLAAQRPDIVGMTADCQNIPTCIFSPRPSRIAFSRWAWPNSC